MWAQSASGEPVPADADLPEVTPDEDRVVESADLLDDDADRV